MKQTIKYAGIYVVASIVIGSIGLLLAFPWYPHTTMQWTLLFIFAVPGALVLALMEYLIENLIFGKSGRPRLTKEDYRNHSKLAEKLVRFAIVFILLFPFILFSVLTLSNKFGH